MAAGNPRHRKVAEQIRRELAVLLWREVRDPRVQAVSLTAVEVTPDLEYAKIFYTMLNGESSEVQKGLQQATGFLRSTLSRNMKLRLVPKLTFVYDRSIERGSHLSQLIDQAVEQDRQHHHEDE